MSSLGVFWSVFSHIRTEYGEIVCISLYSVRVRENADQKNSEYEHFSRSIRDGNKGAGESKLGGYCSNCSWATAGPNDPTSLRSSWRPSCRIV